MIVDGNILEITLNGGTDVWIFELSKEQYTGQVEFEATAAVHAQLSVIR